MGIHSGKFGAIDGISTARNWAVNEVSALKPFVASNTFGATGRRRGNRDWTGSIGHYGGKPLIMPGETFTFKGYSAPDNGVQGTAGPCRTGLAMVQNIAVTWNWEAGDIVSTVTNFGSAGAALSRTSEAVTDATNIDAPSIQGAQIRINPAGGASTYAELCPALSATLNVLVADKPYVNSCTDGETGRKAGPIDWNLSLVVQENDLDDLPFDIDDYVAIQIDIDSTNTNYWQLIYGQVKEFSGYTVDIETGNIITVTIPIEMSVDAGDGDSEGAGIWLPDEVDPWWEAALPA